MDSLLARLRQIGWCKMDDKEKIKLLVELLKECAQELDSVSYETQDDGEETTNPSAIELSNKIVSILEKVQNG